MMRLAAGAVLMSFACNAYGQTADGQPAFEVASIKVAPPPAPGRPIAFGSPPGSNDPGLYTCNFCNLSMLITQVYGVHRYQLSGPIWLDSERFNITAKIPQGAGREQVKPMLQNLLAERFKLAIHWEKKDAQVYGLVVASGGPKFKESLEDDAGQDGFPVLPPGGGSRMFLLVGCARLHADKESMEYLAEMMSDQVEKPVTDATGLKANTISL